jgi:hypothetical protein
MKRQIMLSGLALTFALGALPGFAQDPNPPTQPRTNNGWRKFDPNTAQQQPADPAYADPGAPPQQYNPQYDQRRDPRYNQQDQGQQQGPPQGYQQQQAMPQNMPPVPARITLPAGTWVTVRMKEPLSSDHSQPGDAWMGTLAQPIVANGVVVARRGENVSGVVSEAKKAGRVEGVSRLGLEATEMALADGRQVQMKTRIMERRGDTSYGRDAAAIGGTVATGAAIGAAVNGGVGAGVGAAAGVVASTIGVLLTRGRPTMVYPEQVLSFRLEAPLTIENTQAFLYASQEPDYDRGDMQRQGPSYGYNSRPAYGPPPPGAYYYGGFYPSYGYFYGPSFYFRSGPGYFYFRGHRR